MLKGINKLLTGEILKVLSDMGHGDKLVIADANFPAETCAKRLIRVPGISGTEMLDAVLSVFPLDTYVEEPCIIMALTQSDKDKNMPVPSIWNEYQDIIKKSTKNMFSLSKIERNEFYKRTEKAFVVIQCGEERQYGNIMLTKGVVL